MVSVAFTTSFPPLSLSSGRGKKLAHQLTFESLIAAENLQCTLLNHILYEFSRSAEKTVRLFSRLQLPSGLGRRTGGRADRGWLRQETEFMQLEGRKRAALETAYSSNAC